MRHLLRVLVVVLAMLLPHASRAEPRNTRNATLVYEDGHVSQIKHWVFGYFLSRPTPGMEATMVSSKVVETADLLVELEQPGRTGVTHRSIPYPQIRRISYRWSKARWPLGNPKALEAIVLTLASGEELVVARLACSDQLLKEPEWTCKSIELKGDFPRDPACKLVRTALGLERPSDPGPECLVVEIRLDEVP